MENYNQPFNMPSAIGQQPVTLLGEVSVEPLAAMGIIEEALTQVKDNLTEFAASETFETDILTVFGESANVDLGETIINALAVGEDLPQIIVVPVEQMNGASGGFDSLTGTVYLADTVIASETKQSPNLVNVLTPVIASETPSVIASETKQSPNLVNVLTEELGHYIDSQLNRIDTPGDEGEHFAALVRGEVLSWEDVGRLQREDDRVRILGGLVVEASGEVSFSSATNFAAGDFPTSVAVGDFNDDGISDLAVANLLDDNVSVLLGNGNGGFSNVTNFTVGDLPSSVAVGEFNGDDISDLVVTNKDSSNISVLFGNGKGSFSNVTNFAVGSGPRSVGVGEFNSDGISDLAVANIDDNNVSVLLGNANGSFSNATNFAVGNGPISLVVGEFNRDNISDLAVTNLNEDNVSVLLGNGNGSFSNASNFNVEHLPQSLAVGEFNGDGISDLVVANLNSGSTPVSLGNSDSISVLLGNGNGSFANATNFYVGVSPRAVAVGEFNSDGISDLAVANASSDKVSILLGTGNGSFSNATNFAVGDQPASVAVKDFNGDGISDLAVANLGDDNISILLNTTPITPIPTNLKINNTTTRESDTNKTANFQVTLDTPTNQTVTVKYATANQTAKANQDYQPTNGTLTFSPGETKKTITVPILGDNKVEPKETFQLKLSNPTNAQLKDQLGIGTITNDDKPQPKISISDATIVEGNRGRKNAKFQVTLDAKPEETVTVNYATANQTAKANQDYKPTKSILTFKPGQTRKTITVPILGDTQIEPNETFQLNLSKPRNAILKDRRGIGTIRDNDFAQLSIKDTQITEGDNGKKQAKFTVALNQKINQRVQVNYATSDGTAKQGSDYQKTNGKLTFKPGQTRKTITVPILGDTLDEDNEKFSVTLRKPSKGVKLGDKRAIGTIKDNDEGGDKPGDSFQAAINVGKLTEEWVIVDDIGYSEAGDRDSNDFYRFQTDKEGTLLLILDDLRKDANLELYGSGEELINQSKNDDSSFEEIETILDPGTYYVRVFPQGGDRTRYRLSLELL